MSGVGTIHHPMGDVDARAGKIGLFVQITDFIDRAAVNAHPNVKFGMTLQRLTDFHCAQHRRFRTGAKNQRATVASRQAQKFPFRLRDAELLRSADDRF